VEVGLGRATTRFVAEALGRDAVHRVPRVVWTSLLTQLALGLGGGVIVILATPLFVGKLLHVPPPLRKEAINMFYVVALCVPVIICTRSLRGVLEALQRFDVLAAMQVPSSMLVYLVPAIGVWLGLDLGRIMLLFFVVWTLTALVYLLACLVLVPALRGLPKVDRELLRPMLSFGGWVAISDLVIPIFVYLDRWMVGAMVSVGDVTYYSVPNEMLSRLLIIPSAIAAVIFPAMSAIPSGQHGQLETLYARTLKAVLLIMTPLLVLVGYFAPDLLTLWLGRDFAQRSAEVARILSVGVLFNSLGMIAATVLDAVGRPDLRAKVFLSYVGGYVLWTWGLIRILAIDGAALSWTLRTAMEMVLLFIASTLVLRLDRDALADSGLVNASMAFTGLVTLIVAVALVFGDQNPYAGIGVLGAIAVFGVVTWRYALQEVERRGLAFLLRRKDGTPT
jgi:O-antigen/teichoic acid export membrane protein